MGAPTAAPRDSITRIPILQIIVMMHIHSQKTGFSSVVMLNAIIMNMKCFWGLLISWMHVRRHVQIGMDARISFSGKGGKLGNAGMKRSPKKPAPNGRTINMTSTGFSLTYRHLEIDPE